MTLHIDFLVFFLNNYTSSYFEKYMYYYFTLVTFSSQIGSSYPQELLDELRRPGSQEFIRAPSKESVDNLLRENDSFLKDPLELTESLREDETESLREEETESRLNEPTEEASESRRRVEPNAEMGLVSFFCERSFRSEPVDIPKASLRREDGNAEGWVLGVLAPPPITRESLLIKLAVGRRFKAGMESLLVGGRVVDDSLRKLMDSLRRPTV